MDIVASSSSSSFSPQDSSLSGLPMQSSRRTTHYHNEGGLGYILGVAWTHFRPFMPFFLISCLVVALVYLLQEIAYGGPFTDPQFFSKFEQRWPPPAHQMLKPFENSRESSQTAASWTRISIHFHEVFNLHQKARMKSYTIFSSPDIKITATSIWCNPGLRPMGGCILSSLLVNGMHLYSICLIY